MGSVLAFVGVLLASAVTSRGSIRVRCGGGAELDASALFVVLSAIIVFSVVLFGRDCDGLVDTWADVGVESKRPFIDTTLTSTLVESAALDCCQGSERLFGNAASAIDLPADVGGAPFFDPAKPFTGEGRHGHVTIGVGSGSARSESLGTGAGVSTTASTSAAVEALICWEVDSTFSFALGEICVEPTKAFVTRL